MPRWWNVVHESSRYAADVRQAWRFAVRHPGSMLLSVATVALGIGATTTLLSLAYGTLLRPLPWPEADQLVRVSETREGSTRELPGEFLPPFVAGEMPGDMRQPQSLGGHRQHCKAAKGVQRDETR